MGKTCHHEVPCTCDEYLNRLTEAGLGNLIIQFSKDTDRRQAKRDVRAVKRVLKEKFHVTIA